MDLDAHAAEAYVELGVGATVERGRGDHFVPGFQHARDGQKLR
jgi:hypothetical protein